MYIVFTFRVRDIWQRFPEFLARKMNLGTRYVWNAMFGDAF